MHHRFLKIWTLFISITLASLPVQQAFAFVAMDINHTAPAMDSSHCQKTTPAVESNSLAAVDTGLSDIPSPAANNCCCDQCDTGCSPDCSTHAAPSAVINHNDDHISVPAHITETAVAHGFYSHSFSPPSPPPLG